MLNYPVTGVTHKSWGEGFLAGAQRLWMGMIALFIWLWIPRHGLLDLIPQHPRKELSMAAHVLNTTAGEAEAGGSQASKPEPHQ